MSDFAGAYAKEHGIEHLAPNRAKNAEAREAFRQAKAAEQAAPQQEATKQAQPDKEGHKRLSRAEWVQMKDQLFARQAAEREELKGKHKGEWANVKDEIEDRQKRARAAWRTEYERQKQAAKAEFKPNWRELFKSQRIEERQSAARIEQAARDLMRSKTLVGRTFGALGLARSSFQRDGDLTALKMQRETMLARHEAQQLEARQVQGRLVAQRTKSELAKKQEPRLDIAPVKDTQNREWAEIRARQAAEREAAGLQRQTREKAREQENRQREREAKPEAQERKGKWAQRPVSEKTRQQAEAMRKRDREERSRGDDHGRER